MKLSRLRGCSRAIALLLLLTSSVGVRHFDNGDPACAPVIVDHHDESKHTIRLPIAAEYEHCAICHWTRLPRSPFAAIPFFQAPVSATITVEQRDPFTRRGPALDRLPARAPPVRL